MNDSLDILKKRLLFQSMHRGMKELDTIFTKFAKDYLHTFTLQQLKEYEAFLSLPEADLYQYLLQQRPLPENLAGLKMGKKIQQFVHEQKISFLCR